ncbi:MAG: phospholipase D-like domain-containing protein, partial [Moraxella sp.]|nr:phospholipase D-like domain-containing protein [Moraxella sp.]
MAQLILLAMPVFFGVIISNATNNPANGKIHTFFESIMCIKRLFVIAVSMTVLSACQSLPQTPHLERSIHITSAVHQIHATLADNQEIDNELTFAVGEQTQTHPNLSGYYPISTGANAFAARSILTAMSSHSIDVQYYIWHEDEAGQLMLKDLWDAAERGVMVRILLDDLNGSKALDQLLIRVAKHPNIAIRLANPMAYRNFRFVNYLANPMRTNIRMHNKSMTFDNHLSIIGGRNIGNEYLNNDKSNQFADLDVLLIGEVVPKITSSFDEYWDSLYAYD